MQLAPEKRSLVIYSEGRNYWPHLEGIVHYLLDCTELSFSYLCSEQSDQGMTLSHDRMHCFYIGEGFIRNWLFENLEAKVMLMTMPDIDRFQVKRSRHDVHYVYVQHSLVSLHMIYRDGAFDHYDTIFCAGPHHVREMRAIEAQNGLEPKRLIEHGYGRFDALQSLAQERHSEAGRNIARRHALIAPSWGPEGTIESGVAEDIIDQLLAQDHEVTLRPHPQTLRLARARINSILEKFGERPGFHYEDGIAGSDSLFSSDFMISDWSGAALEYAFALRKPVLFVDVPRKVNNPRYEEIGIEPFEVRCMEIIGRKLHAVEGKYDFSCELPASLDTSAYIFNPGRSAEVAVRYLQELLAEKQ